MRIAYLASLYPAQSHTFILREVEELRALGVEIATYSVRRAKPADILGPAAAGEAASTQALVPPPPVALLRAALWVWSTRPLLGARVLAAALREGNVATRAKWLAYFGEAMLLAWSMRRAGAQHLHCHFGNAGSSTAMLAAKLAGLPLSITFHGLDLNEPDSDRHREKLRACAFAVCISEAGRMQLLQTIDAADAAKAHVIRCGHEAPREDDIAPAPGTGRIVCVARLSPEKGHAVLLDALHMLHRRGTPFHCTLVGGGPLADDIEARIAALGLSDCVEAVGARPPADVMRLIQQSDVAVLASAVEGIPIAIMEAFGYKRPVVATRVGGIGELVRDGENGYLVPAGDARALADALGAVLGDQARGAAMGQAGYDSIRVLHDPKTSALALRALFVRVLDDGGGHESASSPLQ